MNNDHFNTLLKAIESKIKEVIPEFEDVGIFGGGFNGVEDIKKFTSEAPALRVGLSGLSYSLNTNTNQLESTMDLSVLFITKDITIPDSRHKIALQFLEKVLLLVKDGYWGEDIKNTFATDRTSVTAQNYYGPELLGTDIAMWQVNWRQNCLLGLDIWEEDGEFPKKWTAKTDINGDGVVDETAEFNILRSSKLRSQERSEEEVGFEQLEKQYKTQINKANKEVTDA